MLTWEGNEACNVSHCSYCSKLAMMLTITAPVPQDNNQSPKSADCCILPGCKSPKYVDANDGTVHPYCGRTHAEQAKQLGILRMLCMKKCLLFIFNFCSYY